MHVQCRCLQGPTNTWTSWEECVMSVRRSRCDMFDAHAECTSRVALAMSTRMSLFTSSALRALHASVQATANKARQPTMVHMYKQVKMPRQGSAACCTAHALPHVPGRHTTKTAMSTQNLHTCALTCLRPSPPFPALRQPSSSSCQPPATITNQAQGSAEVIT